MPSARRSGEITRATDLKKSRADFWISLGLLLMTLAIYAQLRNHDFINYDDPVYVTENPQVRNGLTWDGLVWAFSSAHDANWIPFTWLSHMLDCQMFGLHAGPHHLINLALHATSVLLLYGFLKRTTGSRWPSAFVAFAFALHPLHVESVAWVAERKDVLNGLFWILTLWAYLYYTERRSVSRYLLMVTVFCCGLMSKPMIVTLPFVLLLLDVWPLRRVTKAVTPLLLEKLPLVALSILGSAVAYLAQLHEGVVSSVNQVPIALRIQNALVTYVIYISNFFIPTNLAVVYPDIPERPVWQEIVVVLVLAGITVLVARKITRRPYLAVGWLWYLGTLVPVIGLVQIGVQSRADRYTYIPMIGISIMLAWAVPDVVKGSRWGNVALAILTILGCSGWIASTWLNLQYWQNSISLFQQAAGVTHRNYIAYNNLGDALRADGRIAEAVSSFRVAVRIRPDNAQAQDNLAVALIALGNTDEAIPHLAEAVRLKPDFVKAHIDLGSALITRGQAGEAASEYELALRLQPDNAEAHYGLGAVLIKQGHVQEAQPHLQRALPNLIETVRIHPDYPDTHYNLGALLELMGRTDEAIVQFAEAVRLRPSDAQGHVKLGTVLAARERLNEAADEFAAAVRINPNYAGARSNLGRVLVLLGRYGDAVSEFSEVLRIDPDFPDARRSLDYAIILRDSK